MVWFPAFGSDYSDLHFPPKMNVCVDMDVLLVCMLLLVVLLM